MKILLSAYACEPNEGSEPGIGWNWAIEIAKRGHKVVVVTRKNNKDKIENVPIGELDIHFIYYDLPNILLKAKPYLGVNIYYILWQIGLGFIGRSLLKRNEIDLIHHITFGVFRNISYLGLFSSTPIIFGPVGGAETSPPKLRSSFNFWHKFIESIRYLLNKSAIYNPIFRAFLAKATLILCKTKESYDFIPKRFHNKTLVALEIGISQVNKFSSIEKRNKIQILFVGRFVYWKGVHLAIRAFAHFQASFPQAELILIGKGPELLKLKNIEKQLNIRNVIWIDWLQKNKLADFYQNSTLFLFCSLHDSSGNVVLEALSNGLPVICLDLGGPPCILGDSMDTIIAVNDLDEPMIVEALSNKMVSIVKDKPHLTFLCQKALQRADEFLWETTVDKVYSIIEAMPQFK